MVTYLLTQRPYDIGTVPMYSDLVACGVEKVGDAECYDCRTDGVWARVTYSGPLPDELVRRYELTAEAES